MDSMLEEYIPVPCRPVFVTARRHISAAMLASIGELLSQVMMCGAWEDKAEAKKIAMLDCVPPPLPSIPSPLQQQQQAAPSLVQLELAHSNGELRASVRSRTSSPSPRSAPPHSTVPDTAAADTAALETAAIETAAADTAALETAAVETAAADTTTAESADAVTPAAETTPEATASAAETAPASTPPTPSRFDVISYISSALTGNLLELNLSSISLGQVPAEIGSLGSLTKLELSRNPSLCTLPEEMASMHSLRTLFALGCGFVDAPTVLGQLPSLRMLSFKSNALRVIPKGALALSIEWLILTDNSLEHLPADFGRLTRLRKCMMTGNRVK